MSFFNFITNNKKVFYFRKTRLRVISFLILSEAKDCSLQRLYREHIYYVRPFPRTLSLLTATPTRLVSIILLFFIDRPMDDFFPGVTSNDHSVQSTITSK